MANEKNDISDIVKKCKILLLDIEGTTTSISFVKDKLFPYAEENVKDFLINEWETDDVKQSVIALRKQAAEDEEKKVDGVVTIPGEDASKDDQIEGLVKNFKWLMSLDRKVGSLKNLQGLIWKNGYDKGDIKGHVYDDVSPAMELWRSGEGRKVYIYSSGSVQAQKMLFSMSSAGDLLKLIDGHFDTAVGGKQEAASYKAIAEKIDCKPEDILFLTDIDKEAEAARSSGVQVALVSREGNAPLSNEVAAAFAVLSSMSELAITNKRKPDAQDEQPANKVLKTDVETNVKTATETVVNDEPAQSVTNPPSEKSEEPEKMEVEEDVVSVKQDVTEDKPAEVKEKIETIVEEVTDSNEAKDLPVCDIQPIVESPDKTEEKETEKMDTESADGANSVSEPKENEVVKNGDKDAPVAAETPPAVITEIKDITNDKESLSEVTETIDDIVPVVEEPAQDIEELQNVGEVLQKECDEILSKVQDVTNLDNIPVKPLLNPIAEETMETDNIDSNDIVERILDKEQEMEMKQNADIELNNVQKVSEEKPTDNKDSKQETSNEKVEAPTEEPAEKVTEKETKSIEEKVESNVVVDKSENGSTVDDKVNENGQAESKMDETSPKEEKVEENVVVKEQEKKIEVESVENKMETDVTTANTEDSKPKVEENNKEELDKEKNKVVEKSESDSKEASQEQTRPAEESSKDTEKLETPIETKESDKVEESKAVEEKKEVQVNGKTTNGDAGTVTLNGDTCKNDELNSRLSMENGKEVVNGSNGDSSDAEKTKNENNGEAVKDVADIKVKTIAVDEPRNDPIEQPTEA